MMRWTPIALLLLTLSLSLPALGEQAFNPVSADDKARFAGLYASRVRIAQNSNSAKDKRELAAEMMNYASSIPDELGLQCLIYIESIPLAASGMDLEAMLRAAKRLDWLWPGHEASGQPALLKHAERAYYNASRNERAKIASIYIDMLIKATTKAEKQEDIKGASALCIKANKIARQVESKRRDEIETIQARLSATSSLLARIDSLANVLRKNPKNRPAARELVDLLVVKRDNPEAAAEFAPMTGDPALTELLTAVANGVDRAQPPIALRLGDWYLLMAEQQNDTLAEPLLRRSRQWYEHFLAVYPRQDALARRVTERNEVAINKIYDIEAARRASNEGQWVDLIATKFDPDLQKHGVEQLRVRNGEIAVEKTSFIIPVKPEQSYELRVRLTIHRGAEEKPAMILYMPAGDEAATIRYNWTGRRTAWLDGADKDDLEDLDDEGGRRDREWRNRIGKEIELVFQTKRIDDEETAIALLVDGVAKLRWQGDIGDLEINEDHEPGEEHGRVFKFICPSRMTFHSIELREH